MNHTNLMNAISEVCEGLTLEQVVAAMKDKTSRAYRLSRAVKRYHLAHEASRKFGLIGVGCISFANARLATYCKRTNLSI